MKKSKSPTEDIVRCEEIEWAGIPSALNAFRRAVCQLGRQERRRLEEEERRREAREEAKRGDQQRLKEGKSKTESGKKSKAEGLEKEGD